jgi:hypothetical protein
MKNILLIFTAALLMSVSAFGQDSEIYKAREIYWLGIDYNHCYFITSYDFTYPSALYSKLDAWNTLVFSEREKYLDKNFKNKQVTIASSFITALNDDVDIKEHMIDDLSKEHHLSKEDIAGIVKKYNFPDDISGVGLILIAESYSKPSEAGTYYATFVDIKTKKVLATDRMVGKTGGFGLRNYWAKTFYLVLREIGKRY